MAVDVDGACSRQQLCVAELARRAVTGTTIVELTGLAIEAFAEQAGIRSAVARNTLGAALQSTAEVDEELRPFLESLTTVLALAHRLESVRSLIDRMPDAIVRFDTERRCDYINASGEEMLGLSAEQVRGAPVSRLGLADLQRGALELALQLTIRTAREQRLELRVGDRRYDTRLVPEAALSNGVDRVVTIWREIG